MKTTKRLIAMAAALTLTACAAAPVFTFAEDVNVKVLTDGNTANEITNIKPSEDKATHTYTAYQIFKGEYTFKTGDSGDKVFKITGLGVNAGDLLTNTKFLAFKKDDTSKTVQELITASGATTADAKAVAAAQALDGISADSAKAKELAEIFDKVKTGDGTNITTTGVNLSEGYYLINDSYTAGTNTNDAVSRLILRVNSAENTSGITIVPKKSYPSVEKKVKENDKTIDGTPINDPSTTEKWNDVADYDIGSDVPFKLYGTMPDTIGDYEHYYYKFTDTLGSEFEVNTNTITVKIDGTTITPNTTNCSVSASDGTITVAFKDIKAYSVTKDSKVTVEYTAKLTSNAKIGLPGQQNEVYLTYSNNPNVEYNPTTDETPSSTDDTTVDKVIVFTYELDVTKIDAISKESLSGAKFKLKKGDAFAVVGTDNKFQKWGTETDATVLTSDSNGLFKIIGLDSGTYTLIETATSSPDYVLPANPFEVVLNATTVNNQTWAFTPSAALTKLELNDVTQDEGTTDGSRGQASMTIENSKVSTLPTTGGTGTKVLYAIGGTILVGAGMVLVSKKRAQK